MNIYVDFDAFDNLQSHLVGELIQAIHRSLADLELSPDQLKEAVTTVTFEVCNVIDGTSVVERSGVPIIPVLTFARSEDVDEVVSCGGSSFMHEYVHGTVSEVLGGGEA